MKDQNIDYIKKEIRAIKKRNIKVETDKAWETSVIRRLFVATSTYILVLLLMVSMRVEKPFISSVVPAFAYLVSTMSLEVVKKMWMKNKFKKSS